MRALLFLFSFCVVASIPEGKLPEGVTPLSYDLSLNLDPKQKSFSAKVQILLRLSESTSSFWMHGQDLTVSKAEIQIASRSIPVTYTQESPEGVVKIQAPENLPTGEAMLTLEYQSNFRTDLTGLYRVSQNRLDYIYSQFEPISARSAFPCFDEPRFKTPFQISMTIPRFNSGISNGRLMREFNHRNKTKTLYFEKTPALPTYLIAFAVGPFDIVSVKNLAHHVPLRGVAPKGQGAKLAYALQETPKILDILEDYFDIPYPYSKLDIIAVPDFAAGAMENAGAITFRDSLLLIDPATAPVLQTRRFAEVMAHELAHQWFGNLVTMAWWDDIWLNEAFATWMATKTMEVYEPNYHANLDALMDTHHAMTQDSFSSSRRIQEPILSHHDIYSAFDAITYTKGAAVIGMFEGFIGPKVFQKGVQSYLKRFEHGNADTQDFIGVLSQSAGQDLSESFNSFLTQAGVPLLTFSFNHFEQSRYLPLGSNLSAQRNWDIPFCPLSADCSLLKTPAGTLLLEGFPSKNGLGYYLFNGDYPSDQAYLNSAEEIALIANLKAAFTAGHMDAETLLPKLQNFSQSEVRHIATAPISSLKWIQQYALSPKQQDAFRAYAQSIYENKPAINGSEEAKLFEADYLDFQSQTAWDKKVRRQLFRKAFAYLKKRTNIDNNQLKIALVVLMQEKPSSFAELARMLSKSNDSIQRTAILRGLAESERVLDLEFLKSLRKNEILAVLTAHMSSSAKPTQTIHWFEKNIQGLLEILPKKSSMNLPWVFASLCNKEQANSVKNLLSPLVQNIPGAPRSLEGSLEMMRLCSSLSEYQRPSVNQFLIKLSKPTPVSVMNAVH